MYQELTTIFVGFTLVVFLSNFLLTVRALLKWKPDEFKNFDTPAVAILVPAYNEEVNIIDSVNTMLQQDYKGKLEVIVVDDGSTDETSSKLIREFKLRKSKDLPIDKPNNVRGSIQSVYKNKSITLIVKENGGKGDALNAGFSISKSSWIVGVDGDTLLEPHAISTMIGKKDEDSDAIASMVGITNTNKVEVGKVVDPKVPSSTIGKIQWIEYNRSYNLLRHSLKDKNCVTVMPGCCSMISREMFEKTNGYKHDHLGEDMEITLNIHKHEGKIQFLSEVLSWTEAPTTLKELSKQRVRWFRGALQSFSSYTSLLFRKENKVFSWIILPYIWIADVFGAWIELLGWIVAIYTITYYNYDYTFFILLWTFIIVCHYVNMLIGIGFMHKHITKIPGKKKALLLALLEGVTYHYLYVYWMLKAHTLEFIGASRKWNKLERKGFN